MYGQCLMVIVGSCVLTVFGDVLFIVLPVGCITTRDESRLLYRDERILQSYYGYKSYH